MQSSQTNQQQQQQQNAPGAAPNGVAGGAGLPQGGTAQSNQAPATQTTGATGTATTSNYAQVNGGRFDFDDGGTFCGGWEDGKAHGHGVCTGPKGQGAYAGSWHYGFEVSGVYTWPSGSVYEGQWQNGKRHGLGMETRGGWLYRGEWTQGFKGRYGVKQSTTSTARYEGTWSNGLQDGYGSETYADSGSYQGQWSHGCRHGYGVRASAPFGLANHYKPKQQMRSSMTSLKSADGGPISSPTPEPNEKRDRRDDSRGGFVLKARSDDPPPRRKSLTEKSLKKGILANLKIRKQKSTGDLEKRGTGGSIRSNASSTSWMSTESSQSQASALIHSDSNASFVFEDDQMDASVVETYSGEWVEDKRTGFGISERSNGLRYEGQWFNNTKYGYGVTTLRDGSKEEGKYKNNVLITSQKKKHMFLIRSAKFRERIEAAVNAAQRASKIALQKADIAISRTATARGKAELADIASEHAREDAEIALQTANQFAPDFRPPGLERLKNREIPKYVPLPPPQDANTGTANANKAGIDQQKLQHGQQDTSSTPLKTRMQNETTTSTIMSDVTQTITPSNRRTSMRPAGIPLTNQNPNMLNMIPNQIPLGSSPNQIPLNSGMLNAQGATTSPDPNQQLINNLMSQNPISGQQQVAQANQPSTSNYINTHQNNSYMPFQNPADYYSGYQQPPINQGYPLPQGYPSQQPGMNQYVQSMYNQQQQQPQQQQTQQLDQNDGTVDTQRPPNTTSIRRNSRVLSPQDRPMTGGIGQTLNDRLDHYKRPPSRDSSVDRYARAHSRLTGSRQPSVDKTVTNPVPDIPDSRSIRGPSVARGGTPLNGSVVGSGAATPVYAASNTSGQFEGALLRNRNLGQDILPSPGQPKRTESLYVAPVRGSGGGGGGGGGTGGSKALPVSAAPLQRKKSLPDVAQPVLLTATTPLSREEVSHLSSLRREEIRRQIDESERLRANPLLYLVSPQVKDWFSRQQLVMLVLFINISLALMFIKLLT